MIVRLFNFFRIVCLVVPLSFLIRYTIDDGTHSPTTSSSSSLEGEKRKEKVAFMCQIIIPTKHQPPCRFIGLQKHGTTAEKQETRERRTRNHSRCYVRRRKRINDEEKLGRNFSTSAFICFSLIL